jgi:GAF domain-containing protein
MDARMSEFASQYETSRLTALERYAVLDTEREAIFDQFAAMTAQLLEAPISIVGMIDQTRHWFKAAHGTNTRSNLRENSFCTYTVQSDQVFTVENALADRRFATNPDVTGAAHLRAYAGAPLLTPDGLSIGTLCIFDTSTRVFSDAERDTLTRLAALVMHELEDRLARINAGTDTPETREQALDRAIKSIGERLGLPVLKLYGSRQALELGALHQEAAVLEDVFKHLKRNQPEEQPNPNLKLKLLERLRFTRNHNDNPAPARALLLGDDQAIVAHAFDETMTLQAWSKQTGLAATILGSFTGSALTVRLPNHSTLIGLSTQSNSNVADPAEPDWLALGELTPQLTSR